MKLLQFLRAVVLLPFTAGYMLVVRIRNWAYDVNGLKRYNAHLPVIAIGNLSTGGTGKTPFAEYLLSFFSQHNIKAAYISRGYGRKTKGFLQVDPSGGDSLTYGDEALQVAVKFPQFPVIVAENRAEAIQKILDIHHPEVIILDDAFQHRKVNRDLDFVLIDANRMPEQDWLLPGGNLREPISSLKRADAIIFNKLSKTERIPALQSAYQKWGVPLAYTQPVRTDIRSFINPQSELSFSLADKEIFLFCGVGNNKYVYDQLANAGFTIRGHSFFPDHYPYKEKDIQKILGEYQQLSMSGYSEQKLVILTTEKDFFRLKGAAWMANYLDYPLLFMAVEIGWWQGLENINRLIKEQFEDRLDFKKSPSPTE
ncbi:MAG: tetraacyldisaccharide 4'-kinase [Bacteroidota bacterium]